MELALWDEPVGSGPCKFVSETPGSQLVLGGQPGLPAWGARL